MSNNSKFFDKYDFDCNSYDYYFNAPYDFIIPQNSGHANYFQKLKYKIKRIKILINQIEELMNNPDNSLEWLFEYNYRLERAEYSLKVFKRQLSYLYTA